MIYFDFLAVAVLWRNAIQSADLPFRGEGNVADCMRVAGLTKGREADVQRGSRSGTEVIQIDGPLTTVFRGLSKEEWSADE